MLDVLFWIIVVCVLLALFKGPLIWVLGLIQKVVVSVLLFYFEGYTIEKIVITIVVLWIVKTVFNLLFKRR